MKVLFTYIFIACNCLIHHIMTRSPFQSLSVWWLKIVFAFLSVLICISATESEMEHLFLYLWTFIIFVLSGLLLTDYRNSLHMKDIVELIFGLSQLLENIFFWICLGFIDLCFISKIYVVTAIRILFTKSRFLCWVAFLILPPLWMRWFSIHTLRFRGGSVLPFAAGEWVVQRARRYLEQPADRMVWWRKCSSRLPCPLLVLVFPNTEWRG